MPNQFLAAAGKHVDDRDFYHRVATRLLAQGGTCHIDKHLGGKGWIVDTHIELKTLIMSLSRHTGTNEVDAVRYVIEGIDRLHGNDVGLVVSEIIIGISPEDIQLEYDGEEVVLTSMIGDQPTSTCYMYAGQNQCSVYISAIQTSNLKGIYDIDHNWAIYQNGLFVEYLYSFVRPQDGDAMIVFQLSDPERAQEALESTGITILTEEQLITMTNG